MVTDVRPEAGERPEDEDEPDDAEPVPASPVADPDAASSEVLRAALQELADEVSQDGDLVIDLSDVPFLDSAGLGAVISGVRAIRQKGGNVVLRSPRPSVANLLRTTEIDQIVDVV